MSTFSMSGERNGRHVSVTWTDGNLSGDEATVAWLTHLAQQLDGTQQGQLGGPYTIHDHLSSPYTAAALMRQVFGRTATQHGALPPLPDPPKGAVR